MSPPRHVDLLRMSCLLVTFSRTFLIGQIHHVRHRGMMGNENTAHDLWAHTALTKQLHWNEWAAILDCWRGVGWTGAGFNIDKAPLSHTKHHPQPCSHRVNSRADPHGPNTSLQPLLTQLHNHWWHQNRARLQIVGGKLIGETLTCVVAPTAISRPPGSASLTHCWPPPAARSRAAKVACVTCGGGGKKKKKEKVCAIKPRRTSLWYCRWSLAILRFLKQAGLKIVTFERRVDLPSCLVNKSRDTSAHTHVHIYRVRPTWKLSGGWKKLRNRRPEELGVRRVWLTLVGKTFRPLPVSYHQAGFYTVLCGCRHNVKKPNEFANSDILRFLKCTKIST